MILKVRIKLTGHNLHEPPVPLTRGDQLPHVGDLIEIPFGGRVIRACVTLTSPPVCRSNGSIIYVVYASEAAEAANLSHPGS
jgi:hypothetical protein